MKFRTEIPQEPASFEINYRDSIMLVGSCFTENIGLRLKELLFQTEINPFGVVYNPVSVKRSMDILISGKEYKHEAIEYYKGLWFSWDHHSAFSDVNEDTVLQNINERIKEAGIFLKRARYIFFSFGTARVYRYRKSGNIVCNCHKLPSSEFTRELLKIQEITELYDQLIRQLVAFNPNLRFIFTVSPVRHWKDGAHGNNISKSVLHLSVEEIINNHSSICHYFPSYEILIDDLRDYRYYNEDLLHPNDQAIDYIWEKFSDAYFNSEMRANISRISEIIKAAKHRVINPDSSEAKKFLKSQQQKLGFLKKELPFLNWTRLQNTFGLD